MVRLMATELRNSIFEYHSHKRDKADMTGVAISPSAGYDFGRHDTCSATAIHRQIVALRQELLALDKEWR
jgi:hypothetical protein